MTTATVIGCVEPEIDADLDAALDNLRTRYWRGIADQLDRATPGDPDLALLAAITERPRDCWHRDTIARVGAAASAFNADRAKAPRPAELIVSGGEVVTPVISDPAAVEPDASWKVKDWRNWFGRLPDSVRVAYVDGRIDTAYLRMLVILYAAAGDNCGVHGTPARLCQMLAIGPGELEENLRDDCGPLTEWVTVTVHEQTNPFTGDSTGREWWEVDLAPAGTPWTKVPTWWVLRYHADTEGHLVARPKREVSDRALLGALKTSTWAIRSGTAEQAAADLHRAWQPGRQPLPADPAARRAVRDNAARAYRLTQDAAVLAGLITVTRRGGGHGRPATRHAVAHPDQRGITTTRRIRTVAKLGTEVGTVDDEFHSGKTCS